MSLTSSMTAKKRRKVESGTERGSRCGLRTKWRLTSTGQNQIQVFTNQEGIEGDEDSQMAVDGGGLQTTFDQSHHKVIYIFDP